MDLFSTLQALVKPLTTLAYAGFGIFLLASAAGRKPRFKALSSIPAPFIVAYTVWLVLLAISLHSYFLVASVFLGVAIFAATHGVWRSRNLLLSVTGVVVLSISMAWWLPTDSQTSGWWRVAAFGLILWCLQAGFTHVSPQLRRSWRPLLFLLYGLAGFAILANMRMYEGSTKALKLLLHHQGAYIGPALHIKAGLIPFYDIPLQYGLGPSLSIAAVCGASNCWAGMELVMVTSTLVMAILLLSMALSTSVPRGNLWLSAATLAIFIAVFLWPGFSFMGSIPAASPSTGGLRFLPVTLVAFLLFFGREKLAALALVPAVLWSPEVAVMSLVVFGVHQTARLGFLKAAIRSAAIIAGSVLGLVLVDHAVYGVWVQPDVFAEYILHVPGPLPIDPIGNLVFLVAAMGLAAWNVWRQPGDRLSFQRDLVVTSLLFAGNQLLSRSQSPEQCLQPDAADGSGGTQKPRWSYSRIPTHIPETRYSRSLRICSRGDVVKLGISALRTWLFNRHQPVSCNSLTSGRGYG